MAGTLSHKNTVERMWNYKLVFTFEMLIRMSKYAKTMFLSLL